MKQKPKPRKPTGAPCANIFEALTKPPTLASQIHHTRKQRNHLVQFSSDEIKVQIRLALLELAERSRKIIIKSGKLINPSADDLATVAILAAGILEELAATDLKGDIISAASRKNWWPVNMQLGVKGGKVSLVGRDKVKTYLMNIRLGQNRPRIFKNLQNPDAGIFSKAAELLYCALLDWRELGAWRGKATEWGKQLISLEAPITPENAHEWWVVAKAWMDEQWEANNDFFTPLINHLGLQKRPLYPSEIKRRVIDDSLKKAFMALPSASVFVEN